MQLVLRENNPFDFKFINQAFIFLIFFFSEGPSQNLFGEWASWNIFVTTTIICYVMLLSSPSATTSSILL